MLVVDEAREDEIQRRLRVVSESLAGFQRQAALFFHDG
jgi:hypothetical protein